MSGEKREHWEKVYSERQADEVSWYQRHPEFSLELIRATGISLDAALIDVGGGASRLIDSLLEKGYSDLSVLDIAAAALQQTQQRLGPISQRVTWLEGDVTRFRATRPYALWHDRAVFHFLTAAEERQRYLEVLKAALPPGGHLIMATFAPDGPTHCSNLPVERYDAPRIEATLGSDFTLQEWRSEAHTTPRDTVQHFLYFRFRRA